jgi:hypothetical protein
MPLVLPAPLQMNILAKPICAVIVMLAVPAWADISRDGAAAAAQRLSSGRVLSVEKTEAPRRPAWRVKVVTGQGEVRVILIDAGTGQAL